MNKKLKKALKSTFIAPKPTRKFDFLNNLPYPKTSNLEISLSQIGYIRKRFWCCSVLLLIGMLRFSFSLQQGKEIVGILAACLPLFTLTGITEISKSVSFNMTELEMSCKYNFGKITLLRFSAIGVFHLIIILFMLIIFKGQSQYGMFRYVLYAVTPFLLSSYLSFLAANRLKSKDTLYVCSGVTAFITIAVFAMNLYGRFIYAENYTMLWSLAFIAAAVLLLKEIYYLLTERNEQWNFA